MFTVRRARWVLVFASACIVAGCAAERSDAPEDSAPDAVAVTVQALGDPPENILPSAQTTNEDSTLSFSTFNGNQIDVRDADNRTLNVQITVTNGTFVLGPVVNNVSVTGNGTHSVIISGAIAVYQIIGQDEVLVGGIKKALEFASFRPAANYNGSATLQMNSSDNNGEVDFDVLDITVTSFNDAPVNNVPTATQSATEDVPVAFAISVNDVDVGSAEMLVSLSSNNSTLITLPTVAGLDFESGDGTADAAMSFRGTISNINAALNGLTITAPANFIGPSSLVITTNDEGASGNGIAGSDTDTLNIEWGAVNDAPVNSVPGAQATVEETPLTFSAGNGNALGLNDADGPTTLVQVTLSATGGTLTLGSLSGISFTAGDGSDDATMTFRGTLFSLNNAIASTVFTPALNFTGNAVLTMISNDLGNTGSGGAKQDTDTVAIAVSGVNDAPVNSVPEDQITTEDVAEVFSTGNGSLISVSDAEASTLQVTLTAQNGAITLSTTSGLTLQTGDGTADPTMTFTGTVAAVNSALSGLSFRPTANFSGDAALTILTSDRGSTGTGGTLTDQDVIDIVVVAANDPPDAVNDSLTVAEDSAATQITARSNDSGLPDVGETLTITGVGTPLHGTASTDGNVVTYQPTANYAGQDSFTYTLSDGNGGSDVATISITVTNSNDAPTAVDDSFTVLQSSGTTLNVLANDSSAPDSGETLRVTAVSVPGHGTATLINDGAAVSYAPTAGYTGDDSFTYTISDGNGGTANATVDISVQAVNTSPVNTLPGPQTVTEDSTLFFSNAAGNPISVADSNNSTLTVQVTVTNGTFTLGATAGLSVSNNGTASVTAQGTISALNSGLNNSRYVPNANYNGSSTLTLSSADSTGESDLDVLTLTVTAFNDAPVNTMPAGTQSATEDTPKTFGTISISDVDVGGGELLVTLAADNGTLVTLSSTAGLSFTTGDGSADGTMTFNGTLPSINSALNGLTVSAPANFIGTSALSLTVSDQGGTGTGGAGQDTDSISISWVSVNDPPVNTVPGAQAIDEEALLAFTTASGTALRVSDSDVSAGLVQVTLSATSGTLTLGSPSSVGFTSGDGTADASMTFTGTLANVNLALEGTVYTPQANFAGTATLTLVSSDLGNSGSGGAKTDTDTITVTIAGGNDAPVNTVPGTQSTNEDVVRVFSTANGNGISVADVDATSLQVSLSATSGTATLAVKTGLTFQAGDGTADASMTFTGTIASINAALNGLSFAPSANFNGAASLTVLTSDLGATGTGGTRVDSDAITINVAPVNDAPDAVNDALTVDEDAPPTDVLVLTNDSALPDPGDALSIASVGTPAHGTAVIAGSAITYTPAADYRGADSFTYTVSDGAGGEDTATVLVTVVSVNDPPTAADDTFSVQQNSGANVLSVLSNDSALPDSGETLSITGASDPAHGSVTIGAGSSTVSYTPDTDYTGGDSFEYTLSDGAGGVAVATVNITVTLANANPVNHLPAPQTTNEDLALFFSAANGNPITVTPADVGGSTLSVQITVQNGTFQLGTTSNLMVTGNNTSTVTAQGTAANLNTGLSNARYTPTLNFNGAPTLTMLTTHGAGSDLDVLTMTVTAVNDPPVNTAPTATQAASEDVPKSFTTVSIVDPDVGSGVLLIQLTADNGTSITLGNTSGLSFTAGDGTADAAMTFTGTLPAINTALNGLTVTAPSNFLGGSTLALITNDQGNSGLGSALQDSDTINLSWTAVNDPPIQSVPGAQSTLEDTPVVFNGATGLLSVTDADVGGSNVRVTFSTTNGTVSLGNPGAITTAFTAGDGTNDTTMTFTGTLADVNSALDGASFTPNPNFVGSAVITLVTNDLGNSGGSAQSDTDTIAVTVSAVNDPPVNSVPLAQNTSEEVTRVFSASNGNQITVADGDATALQVTLSASNATLTLGSRNGLTFQAGDGTADASMTFTGPIATINSAMNNLAFIPTPNFNGSASIAIQSNDMGATGLGGAGIDEDLITINVLSVNDVPDAVNDSLIVAEDAAPTAISVLANDTDAPDSGELLTVTLVSTPAHGTASTDGTTVSYQPAANYGGSDSFTYTINDGNGGTDTATVAVTVTPVNDPPDAVDDSTAVIEGSTGNTLTVLTNDSFAPDLGESLTISEVGTAEHGTVAIGGSGQNVTYTPEFAYHGPDSFTYTIGDGNGGSDTATVTVEVTSVDTQPEPATDTVSVNEDGSVVIDVLANDSGLSDLPIALTIAAQPAHGTVTVDAENKLLYTPATDYNGLDTLTYTVTDVDGDLADGTVGITVLQVDDVPSAATDTATTEEDTAVVVAVLDNDTGIADVPLIVTIEDGDEPSHGQAIPQTDGTVSYVPDPNYNGSDAFTYTVTDSTGTITTAEVLVTVTPVSDPPDAVADTAAVLPGRTIDIDVLANDTDPDGDAFTIESVTRGEQGGAVTDNGDGTVHYTPPTGLRNVTDTFTYTIVDDDGDTDTAMVVVAVGIDSDMDGILDADEAEHGTDPDDADSDDDGIDDGLEVATTGTDPTDDDSDDDGLLDGSEDADHDGELGDGETDPLQADTDGDGVQDGTELGAAEPQGSGTDPNVFVADFDPSTTTDPRNADSDGDGLSDGTEDSNGDGEVGPRETDPNDASDNGAPEPDPDDGTSEPDPDDDDDDDAAGECEDGAGDCEPDDGREPYTEPPKESGGCSVGAASGGGSGAAFQWLLLPALALLARRRRIR